MLFNDPLLKLGVVCLLTLAACSDESEPSVATAALDPDTTPRARIDRFSAAAGTLQVRDATNGLPGPDEPVDFDEPPFITRGLGPLGQSVVYYNFDVQPTEPAPIYVLIRQGENAPVAGQLNVVDAIPGDPGYNDFWQVTRVRVPTDYVANTITSLDQIMDQGATLEPTDMLVNCPVVPEGSTAERRATTEPAGLVQGWYRGQVIQYFSFSEHPLSGNVVPVAPIYVTFNLNPDQQGGGPASGFRTEPDSDQTHNVLSALPGSNGYSPLWSVSPYDNADFATVMDLTSAAAANRLAEGVANVNCPVFEIDD
ncbi:MAG: hypothetical protein ABI895_41820 [Deltaproteobacteria bacterium]